MGLCQVKKTSRLLATMAGTLLAVLCSFSSLAQECIYDLNQKFPAQALKEDLDYLEAQLPRFHPDPYRYISKDSLHAYIAAQKNGITHPLTEMQFRVLVKQIIARIGCGHTDVGASEAYAKQVLLIARPLLPLNAVILDSSKVYVLNNLSEDTTIKAGSEVLSIDSIPARVLVEKIYSVYSSDGYNTSYKKQGVRYDWFKYYYGQCYGFKSEYVLRIKDASGQIKQHLVQALPSVEDTLIMAPKPAQDTIYKTSACAFWIDRNNNNLAVIDINSFSGKHWRRFYRKSFRYIRQHHIDNLTIDLRDNGGGRIGKGMYFLSHIIPKNFAIAFDRKPNLIPFNKTIHMAFSERVTPILFMLTPLEIPHKGRLRHFYIGLSKHRNGFRGHTYVLTNGKSFSMSCISASYLKYKAGATTVGEETGGNIAGSNAIVSGRIYLPRTQVRIFIPLYHIYHRLDVDNNGYGILPDHPVHYNIRQVIDGRDLEMEKVRELIQSGKATHSPALHSDMH